MEESGDLSWKQSLLAVAVSSLVFGGIFWFIIIVLRK